MNYYFKENEIVAFDNNVVISTKKHLNGPTDFCIDEQSFKLFEALGTDTFKIENGTLVVKKSKILLLDNKPPILDANFTSSCEINLDKLTDAFKFSSKNPSRAILQGVLVNSVGTICATDGAKMYIYYKGDSKDYIVLSVELVKELVKYRGTHIIKFNSNIAQIELDGTTITGRLYAGQYPNALAFFEKQGTPIAFDLNKLNQSISIGGYIDGANKRVTFVDNNIAIYENGDAGNIYIEEFPLNVEKLSLSYESLKLALNCFDSFEFQYLGTAQPVFFSKDNIKVVLMPMK